MILTIYHYHGRSPTSKRKESHDEKIQRLFPQAKLFEPEEGSSYWQVNTDLTTFANLWEEKFAVYPSDSKEKWRVFIIPYSSFGSR